MKKTKDVTVFITDTMYNTGIINIWGEIMRSELGGNIFRTTLLCIDSYENRILKGRFSNSYYEDGVPFESTMDFLLKTESMLEEMNWPQSFSIRRSFQNTEEKPSSAVSTGSVKEGNVATFSLRILFRQNSSWQGALYWHNGKKEESFRSVLELLMLIDSALS